MTQESGEEELDLSPTPGRKQELIKQFAPLKRFVERMPDVAKLVQDLKDWSAGDNWDDPEREENYPGWTEDDFKELVEKAGL